MAALTGARIAGETGYLIGRGPLVSERQAQWPVDKTFRRAEQQGADTLVPPNLNPGVSTTAN